MVVTCLPKTAANELTGTSGRVRGLVGSLYTFLQASTETRSCNSQCRQSSFSLLAAPDKEAAMAGVTEAKEAAGGDSFALALARSLVPTPLTFSEPATLYSPG